MSYDLRANNHLYDNKKPGDIVHSYADITAIKIKLNFKPVIGFLSGLNSTIN